MGFEPLQTDEKLYSRVEGQKEFEAQMMGGCTTIGLGSVAVFALCAWPWFVVQEYRVAGLQTWLMLGALPALALGAALSRLFGLAGASGFVGGSLISAVFVFLRLDQSMMRNLIPDVPRPDYPDIWKYLVPLIWILVSMVVAGLLVPSKEFRTENVPDNSQ